MSTPHRITVIVIALVVITGIICWAARRWLPSHDQAAAIQHRARHAMPDRPQSYPPARIVGVHRDAHGDVTIDAGGEVWPSDDRGQAADDDWPDQLHRMNRELREPAPEVQQWDFTQWELDRFHDLGRIRTAEANVWDFLATRQLASTPWLRRH